ncbi:MAG: UDP-N-acetylmuramate dehydrogenase [Bacteroidota bacterium]|jgi:UDP-N-acetylmuramate dehydrogenase
MFSLRGYNTFGIEAKARQFVEISSTDQYVSLRKSGLYADLPHLFLGGGSNVLLTKQQEALVVKISIPGISVVKEDVDFVWLKAGAGVVWDELVQYSVDKAWSGLENLSLIPGTVGAAPMQNIGAYGVEIKDTFESLEALNLQTLEMEVFDAKACAFGYRESFFKRAGKGKYLISSVTFKLSKKPSVKTSYGAIQDVLAAKGIDQPSIREVADAVIEIRKSKLPDPKDIGNSGSFFKNPTVSLTEASRLMAEFPGIPNYPVEGSTDIKFPAGWFIEKAGWKGFRRGDAGVHAKQALVLVNYGEATGGEILALSEEIKQSIKDTFGISLETEVNIL